MQDPEERPSRTVPTSPASARAGGAGNASWTGRGSSSSTRPAATNLARRYGRSPLGARLVAAVPHGDWRTTTFVAGLRQSGVFTPLVLDGPMTGTAFRAHVEQFLAPALAPGDVV